MTRPLPYTKASVRRAVAAAEYAGLRVKGIAPDGTVIVDNAPNSASLAPESGDNDPYVAAVVRGSASAKASSKRHAHS